MLCHHLCCYTPPQVNHRWTVNSKCPNVTFYLWNFSINSWIYTIVIDVVLIYHYNVSVPMGRSFLRGGGETNPVPGIT